MELDRQIAALRSELAQRDQLNCFRTAIRNMPFGRMGGDLYHVQVTLDPMMVQYGIMAAGPRDGNLTRHLRHISQEVAAKVFHDLLEHIPEARYGR